MQLLGGPLEATVSPHAVPSKELRVLVPEGDNNQPSAPQLSMTVTQNVVWNDALADLCRSSRCAARAPGQPPRRANKCNVLSWIRH